MNILFVCTGNTCRSPMAEAIVNQQWSRSLKSRSAGVFAADGDFAAQNAIDVLRENGIQFDHRSTKLTEEEFAWADVILTMTSGHKSFIMNKFSGSKDKIFTLKEFVGEQEGSLDVMDPFGGDIHVYRATFLELQELVRRLAEKVM